ncbi:hypothetical protein D3C80_2207740 [compost metagenome]
MALVPAGQSLDATLSQQPPKVGVAEVRAIEAGLHLLISHQVGDCVDVRVAAIAGVRHARFSD